MNSGEEAGSAAPEPQVGLAADATQAAQVGSRWRADGRTVIVVNTDRFFLTHRASWAVALQSAGSRVSVIAADTGHSSRIRDLGLEFVNLDLGRESLSAASALAASFRLFAKLLQLRPKRVILIATAAYTLGWPAAVLMPRSTFLVVVTGAGRVMDARLSETRAARVVRVALKISRRLPNVKMLFQLRSDRDTFLAEGLAAADRSSVIAGTGIDLSRWSPRPARRNGTLHVLFAARLFREKGIEEFVEIARRLHTKDVHFIVAGAPDVGVSSSVSPNDLKTWQAQGLIEYVGQVDDMLVQYQRADLFVFPSRHPEGTPRVLIEAAACGVPIVASDQEGCRAVVGETAGLLVDASNLDALEHAVRRVLVDSELRRRLSQAARARAVEQFSLEGVLESLLPQLGVSPIKVD